MRIAICLWFLSSAALGATNHCRDIRDSRDMRSRRCTSSDLLVLLPGGPNAAQIAAGVLLGSKGELVTETRSTTRTCRSGSTLVTLAANQPCVEAQGLSIEAAHTNLLLRSEQLDNAAWAAAGSGSGTVPIVTANAAVAPDGTTTAERLQLSAINGAGATHYSLVGQVQTSPGAVAVTFSVWIRGTSGAGITRIFILAGPTLVGGATVSFTTTWARYSVSGTLDSSPNASVNIGAYGPDVALAPAADIYASDAQLELGTYARSYVATVGTAVTANADLPSMNPAILPVARGRISVLMTPLWSASPGNEILDTRLSAINSGVAMYVQAGQLTFLTNDNGNQTNAASGVLVWVPGQTYTLSGSWGDGNIFVYRDGVLVASVTNGTAHTPDAHTAFRLGRAFTDAFQLDGYISNIRVSR